MYWFSCSNMEHRKHGNSLRMFVLIVSVHPYCASLLCMQIHTPHHAREHTLSNKMNNDRADGHCYSFSFEGPFSLPIFYV